jgi:hypothetical protein
MVFFDSWHIKKCGFETDLFDKEEKDKPKRLGNAVNPLKQ